VARLLLFTGKGGVGKTTLAAAMGARLAAHGHKTLVVSTDPAHSLADVLDVALDASPSEVSPGLYAAQVDTRRLLDGAWSTLRTHLGVVLAGAGVDEVAAEELTVLPGVEELLALTEVHQLAGDGPWEVVVVDCAPTAETLRLLSLPEAVARYLERLFPAHQRVVRGMLGSLTGSRATVDGWAEAVDALSRLAERLELLRATLADPAVTSVRLVLTPERVVVAETRRTLTALALLGIQVDGVVANRVVPEVPAVEEGVAADWLRARRAEQEGVLTALRASCSLAVETVRHRCVEPVGVAALTALGEELGWSASTPAGHDRLVSLRRVAGRGRALDSEFELRLTLPSTPRPPAIELSRIGDELAFTVDGRRRLLALPSALRRCLVVGASQHADGVTVRFRPDPAVWMR
jgi:arsenite/tail-anchored protein-transporting ATPase